MNKNFLIAIPFIGYALFLASIYISTKVASVIFFITVLSTIGITLYLFKDDKIGDKNVEEN